MIVLPDAEDRTIVYRDYYNDLHCEQCGRAVKIFIKPMRYIQVAFTRLKFACNTLCFSGGLA